LVGLDTGPGINQRSKSTGIIWVS